MEFRQGPGIHTSSLSRCVTDPLITWSGSGPLFAASPIKKTTHFVTHLPDAPLNWKFCWATCRNHLNVSYWNIYIYTFSNPDLYDGKVGAILLWENEHRCPRGAQAKASDHYLPGIRLPGLNVDLLVYLLAINFCIY